MYNLKDICVDGGNCFLIPPFSYKKFAKALDNLMKDSEKRKTMANCDRTYLQRFSSENIGRQWEHLFNQLKNSK